MKTKTLNIKRLLLTAAVCCLAITGANAQTTQLIVKGLRVPQLNSVQRSGISNIDADNTQGQLVYNTETNCIEFWDGAAWRNFCENTRWFYMPSIVIDVSADGNFTRDLYLEYRKQFEDTSDAIVNASSPKTGTALVKSDANAPNPFEKIYAADELYYYVTGYDNTVFSNVSISPAGEMSYTANSSNVSCETYMNIVFVVK